MVIKRLNILNVLLKMVLLKLRLTSMISRIFTERKIDLRSINSRANKQEKATISLSFYVPDKESLLSLIEKIRQVDSVIDIERTTG